MIILCEFYADPLTSKSSSRTSVTSPDLEFLTWNTSSGWMEYLSSESGPERLSPRKTNTVVPGCKEHTWDKKHIQDIYCFKLAVN